LGLIHLKIYSKLWSTKLKQNELSGRKSSFQRLRKSRRYLRPLA
jgi:regulator of protease activity HflC (stomatin/prohibitin superfamily)